MTSALEKVLKGTLQKSDSQKAFSPWWEDLEDKLLYSLMIFGMIALPFNMVSNTPVECTVDPTLTQISSQPNSATRYLHFYLRKFCTLNFISEEMIFLPFILILAPLPLVAIGKLFLSFFKVEKRLNMFYNLLVKESLDREDVEAMEKENVKDCHEISQMFRNSNGIYHSFLCRTIVQMIFGTGIGLVLLRIFFYELSGTDISCEVFGMRYTCVVPLANFYRTIVLLSCLVMMVYIFCVIYNLVWLMFPKLSPLQGLMIRSKAEVEMKIKQELDNQIKKNYTCCLPNVKSAEPFFDLYFDDESRDLPFLITLLGTKHGVAETLRLLSLFDKDYQKLWKPLNVKIYHDLEEEQVVHIEWSDAPIANFCHNYQGRVGHMNIEYTLEIFPNSEAPIKTKMYHTDQDFRPHDNSRELKYDETFYGVEFTNTSESTKSKQISLSPGFGSSNNMSKIQGRNEDKQKGEVKIIISTEVNGRTIAQRTEKVPQPPQIVFTGQFMRGNSLNDPANTMPQPKSILKQNTSVKYEEETNC